MTFTSICIVIMYAVLHLIVILVLDAVFRHRSEKGGRYRIIRWFWIIPFVLLAAVPVLATFWKNEETALVFQKAGNIIVAFDMHICGLFLTLSLLTGIVRLLTPKKRKKKRAPMVIILVISIVIGTIVPIYGMKHAGEPVVENLKADLTNGEGTGQTLRVALIADLHLSVNSHLQLTRRMVRKINDAKPDVVLVAGDIFTSSYKGLRNPEQYAKEFRKIKAPMGVYAVYGNHDVEERLFCGFAVKPVSEAFRTPEIEQFVRDCGMKVLCDEVTTIAGGQIQLAGRIDASKTGDGTSNHMSAGELLKKTDPGKPVIVMIHEPLDYSDMAEAGADMVVSGHTHRGQIFPGNLFCGIKNENGYGQKKLHGMETFTTSGVGFFGPLMRTATNSEIMVIDVSY